MSSPISAQQRSVQESSKQFETRMRNMVSILKSADSSFFYKRVTKSMATEVVKGPFAYSLEFPISFIKTHGQDFGIDVTFVMKGTERTWPIKLTVRSYPHKYPRVFAYGPGGWKTFLMENQIKVGDILIFNLLSGWQFQVVIGRAPIEVHPEDHGDDNNEGEVVIGRAPVKVHPNDHGDDNNEGEVVIGRASIKVHPNDHSDDSEGVVDMDIDVGYEYDQYNKSSAKWFRNASPWWNADQAPVSCRVCKLAPPCPRFFVTIRPWSHLLHFSLAVPGRFWELHGNMLECDDLQLKGPNKAIYIVEAKRNYDEEEKKLSVCLESGWAAFLLHNTLEVGDVLEFYLVGNSCFTVDLVERIENY